MKTYTSEELQVILNEHKLWINSLGEKGKRADLIEANLRGANLYGAKLRGADLIEANLTGANLIEANLTGANLRGANLRGANLYGANLRGANLYEANLRGANLIEANLIEANLTGANLSEANLTGAYVIDVIGKTILTFSYKKHQAILVDNELQIGCKHMHIDEWVKNYEAIGKEAGYNKEEIAAYGKFIKMCKGIK